MKQHEEEDISTAGTEQEGVAAARDAAAVDAPTTLPPTPTPTPTPPPPPKSDELCRHWSRTGACLLGDRCRFQHPANAVPIAAPRRRAWGGSRAVVRNRSKATVLRRSVIDAFGREALSRGSGVLDVAGGKVRRTDANIFVALCRCSR